MTSRQNGRADNSLADLPDLLGVSDLCDLTGLSKQTIRKEIVEGRMSGCRIGRKLYVTKTRFLEYVDSGGGLHG